MTIDSTTPSPSHHTPAGGVLVGSDSARRTLVLYEDPQCPYCRQFEEACGDMISREISAGAVKVEWRIRCFLGGESVRAANALALAAEDGKFDDLRRTMFQNQPAEGTGGYAVDDLLTLGAKVGLVGSSYVDGVTDGRYEDWAAELDEQLDALDPQGTPYAVLDGKPVDSQLLYDREGLGALIRG